jgi:hypothetical protein|tara:strand:+ start:63 stop:1895 length:1833 start_codon:yes stop_codon:yes gene_type:complete
MADRADILPIISAGQSMTGGVLAGAGAANDNTIGVLEDLRDIGRQNEENTQSLLQTMVDMFSFDKERFRRERDQLREQNKEKLGEAGPGLALPGVEEMTGGFGAKALAGIAALAFFAKSLGADTDILKLPQQLKSIRAMTGFVKGIGNIGTVGFGGKLIDDAKAAIKAVKVDPGDITKSVKLMFDDTFKGIATLIKGTPDNPSVFTRITNSFVKTLDTVKDTFNTTKASITGSTAFKTITTFADDIKDSIAKTFKPFKDSIMGIFGSATSAGPAGAGASTGGGALAKIIEPLKAIGRTIGKIFLPLTIILGVFDGYKGFEEEYKDEQSILDGLRGGIKGIVDGFIGSFVRIIGSAFDYVLTFFGLDQAGESVSTFAKDVTAAFETSVGGLVDIITGLFSFDLARVKEGVVNLIGGTIDWASDILYAPVNLAINFIRDIFGIGEEDAPAFNFKDYLFGEDGLVNQAVDFIKDIFTIDFAAIGTKFFDMGQMLKAIVLASGSYTATAMNPFTKGDNLEAASKAYEDKYNEVMGGSESSTIEGDTIQGDTSESKVKTDILNQGDTSKGGDIVIGSIDTSTKDQSTKVAKTENSYPPMTTSIDPFHDRMSYGLG